METTGEGEGVSAVQRGWVSCSSRAAGARLGLFLAPGTALVPPWPWPGAGLGRWERWDGERLPILGLMGAGFVLQKRAEGSRPALQHPEEPPGPDQGAAGGDPALRGACLPDSPWSCFPRDRLSWALPSGGRWGDPGARGAGPPCAAAGRDCVYSLL